MGTVCKRLKFGNRWEVRDPIGRKGGLLIVWKDNVNIKSFWSNDFCIEVPVESEDTKDSFRVVFVHASFNANEMQNQWAELKTRRQRWGERWMSGEETLMT